jgi:putative restriction endonuclease
MLGDGAWQYAYFQENRDPKERDAEYTNAGLLACMRDRVPVGVMRQVKPKPNVRYLILGIALVARWKDGYFLLEGLKA